MTKSKEPANISSKPTMEMSVKPDVTASAATDPDVTIDTGAEKVELKRSIGLIAASSLVVGMMIGSGIFISPKGVLLNTGSVALCLLVWVITGLIQMGIALCFAELGTSIPKSGGAYTYIKMGLGNPLAFTFVLQMILIQYPGGLVVILLTFAKYLLTLLPPCGSPELLEKCIAAAAIVTLVVINSYSTRLGAFVAVVTTVAKVMALLVIIVGGIVSMAQGTTSELGEGFEGTSKEPSALALAVYSATWAYSGTETLNIVVEEVKNPAKNIPRAVIISVAVVTILYTMTNVSYLAVMTRAELLNAEAVAVIFGDRVLRQAAKIIPVAVMISTFGASNNTVFGSSRMVFCAARDRNIPDVLSFIEVRRLTPLSAMTLTVTMAMILLVPADVVTLINYIAFLQAFFMGCVFTSLIIFRVKTMKDVERPIKIPLVIPIVMILIHIYLFVAPLVIDPLLEYVYVAAGVFGGSAVLYIPFIHFGLKLPGYDKFVAWYQLMLHVSPPEKHED